MEQRHLRLRQLHRSPLRLGALLPRAAKAATKYAEAKVRSGDVLDSDGSKYSPNSEVSDEDQDKESTPNAVKTKSPSRKQPANDIVAGDEEEDEEEEVSIICL